jgi:hypothetical protein
VTEPAEGVVQLASLSGGFGRRRTRLCTVRAAVEPRHLVVTLSGELHPGDLDTLRAAIVGRSTESLHGDGVASFRPPVTDPDPAFVPDPTWFVGGDADVSLVAPAGEPELHTVVRTPGSAAPASGRRAVRLLAGAAPVHLLDGAILIGRSPQHRPTDPPHWALLPLDDPLLSKTHLAVGVAADAVWVEDRRSSNGTQLVDAAGRTVELEPEVRLTVPLPAQLLAGDTAIQIEWGD